LTGEFPRRGAASLNDLIVTERLFCPFGKSGWILPDFPNAKLRVSLDMRPLVR
jgi:hypothetical protein